MPAFHYAAVVLGGQRLAELPIEPGLDLGVPPGHVEDPSAYKDIPAGPVLAWRWSRARAERLVL